MADAAGTGIISQVNFYSTVTTAKEHKLGQKLYSQIGQAYRFALNGASTLVIGNLIQASAEDTNFKHMAVQAAVATSVSPSANGGYAIPVTLGGTATAAADDFKDGILVIDAGSSMLGQSFTILGNDVQATTNGTCNFYVREQPLVALTTSAFATAYHSPFWKVVQAAGPVTGQPVGGAITAPTAGQYCWLQVEGPGTVLSDATVTAAATMGLSPSAGTAGAVTKAVNQDGQVGVSMSLVSVSARTEGIWWRCM